MEWKSAPSSRTSRFTNCRCQFGKKELEKIIRATYIKEFPPRIVLHGFTFLLKKDD